VVVMWSQDGPKTISRWSPKGAGRCSDGSERVVKGSWNGVEMVGL
jgi:hypothetical protein